MTRMIRLVAILTLALAAQSALSGDHGRVKEGKDRDRGAQGGLTAEQAANEARRQTGGRVLAVQREGGGYRVKVLTGSGEVRAIKIPNRR